ncbi:DUF4407 domain-containing protein [Mucilaginibacter sp. AW1-3]
MNRQENRIISFIGIDYHLLKRSGEQNIAKFYLSGLLVLIIFALSFFSVFYALNLMFHTWYAEFVLATFLSLTFLNIYLLLIQTFSKETLPAGYKTSFFTTSNITRVCFVLMISFLMAQPLRIVLLRDELDHDIENYKDSLYQDFVNRTDQLYQPDLLRLERRHQTVLVIDSLIQADRQGARDNISRSDFFLKRITIAGKYRLSWLICLLVMAIFSLPVYLIYSISENSRYYTEKRNRDHQLVSDQYQEFKHRYLRIFQTRYQLEVEFPEDHEDPPFNWIKKQAPTYRKTADLTDKIVNNGL